MSAARRRTLLAAIGAAGVSTLGGSMNMGEQLARQIVNASANPGTGLNLESCEIVSFDPATFSNRIRYYKTEIENIPVLSGPEALTYQPGDHVACITLYPADGRRTTGLGEIAVLGRIVRPGEANAERAISFMTSALAKSIVDELVAELLVSPEGQALAAFVFASRLTTDEVDALESTTSIAYGDLTTVGPTVGGVEVTNSGKALVFISGNLSTDTGDGANMSFEVSGATNIEAGQTGTLSLVTAGSSIAGSVTKVVPVTLNPGEHTFQAKYRSGGGGLATFNQRVISVIAF